MRADYVKWDPATGQLDDAAPPSFDLSTQTGQERAMLARMVELEGGLSAFALNHGGSREIWERVIYHGGTFDPGKNATEYHRAELERTRQAYDNYLEEFREMAANDPVAAQIRVLGEKGQK